MLIDGRGTKADDRGGNGVCILRNRRKIEEVRLGAGEVIKSIIRDKDRSLSKLIWSCI